MIVHSSFCNVSARLLPRLLVMARAYKAAGADLVFASAETFSAQYPVGWLNARGGPRMFFLRSGAKTPEQLEGRLTVAAATSFINSRLANEHHRIVAPGEQEETVSDPVPEKNDGPVKKVVADNFDDLVLNSNKVSANTCEIARAHVTVAFHA